MKFEGAIPALFTPYDPAGEVSEDMLRRLVEVYIRAGVNGLYLCGGAGEGVVLKTAERKKVVEAVVGQVRGRLPVIVHVGSVSTDEAVELAAHARKAGADAVASVPPFFYPVSPDGVYFHYLRIAEASHLPLIVYNIPALTGVTVTPSMLSHLMNIPSVMGIKFSSYNLFELGQIALMDGGRLNILSGNDEVFLAALAMGAHGSIGLTHNFMPKLYIEIFEKFKSGRCIEARELQSFAVRVVNLLSKFPVIPAAKEIMRLSGYDCGGCRRPLEPLTEAMSLDLHRQLTELNFFEKKLGLQLIGDWERPQ
jgi:N-acetylneuraminate lyase